MGAIASQITSPTIVYSTVYSDAEQREHQSSAPLAFERGIHRGPVNSPHKWPVTRKMFPSDDVMMTNLSPLITPDPAGGQSGHLRGLSVPRHLRLWHAHSRPRGRHCQGYAKRPGTSCGWNVSPCATPVGIHHGNGKYIVRCRYIAVNFFHTYSQKTPHSSPVRARYGLSLVHPSSDWYSDSIPVIISAISYNIGPLYNGTRLYCALDIARFLLSEELCKDSPHLAHKHEVWGIFWEFTVWIKF